MLKIDTSSLIVDNNTPFSLVYFKTEDSFFPSNDWNDFVLVITSWWCQSLLKLLRNESMSEEFLFMDGPFSVKVQFIENGIFNFLFIKNDDQIIYSHRLDKDLFIANFLKEVNSLIRKLHTLNFSNEDFEKLQLYYRNLQQYRPMGGTA